MELTEKEKWIIYQCDEGLGKEEFFENENLNLKKREIKKILKKLQNLGLITYDPYKDKDLEKYYGLKNKEEREKFKKENHPFFYLTGEGEKHVTYNLEWERE